MSAGVDQLRWGRPGAVGGNVGAGEDLSAGQEALR